MSTRRKGTRREKQAREIYEAAGYQVYSPDNSMYGDNDLWNLYDLAAFGPMHGLYRMVQVKSNRAQGVREWCSDARLHEKAIDGVVVDFLVCHDNQGWRLLRPTHDGHTCVYDGRDDGHGMGEGLTEYLRCHTVDSAHSIGDR